MSIRLYTILRLAALRRPPGVESELRKWGVEAAIGMRRGEMRRVWPTRASDTGRLSRYYKLVIEPGPGAMVLRVAITNVQPNGSKKNAGVKGAEIAATHAVAPGVSLLVPRLSVGKVGIEGEIVDSASGDGMVAFMTSKSGRRYFSGLKAWAKGFRDRLDKTHES